MMRRTVQARRAWARMSRERRLDQLESDLKDAIKSENYEEAARLRDLINQAKASLGVT